MKRNAWLVALSFIPFALFGFLFASLTTRGQAQSLPTAPVVQQPIPNQVNILYILVDPESKPHPRVISIWGLFFTTQSNLMAQFMPLYPSGNSLADTLLISKFSIDPNNGLDADFLNLASEYFKVKWSGYVVLDPKMENKLILDLSQHGLTLPKDPATSGSTVRFFDSLCQKLTSKPFESMPANFFNTPSLDAQFDPEVIARLDSWTKSTVPFAACEILN